MNTGINSASTMASQSFSSRIKQPTFLKKAVTSAKNDTSLCQATSPSNRMESRITPDNKANTIQNDRTNQITTSSKAQIQESKEGIATQIDSSKQFSFQSRVGSAGVNRNTIGGPSSKQTAAQSSGLPLQAQNNQIKQPSAKSNTSHNKPPVSIRQNPQPQQQLSQTVGRTSTASSMIGSGITRLSTLKGNQNQASTTQLQKQLPHNQPTTPQQKLAQQHNAHKASINRQQTAVDGKASLKKENQQVEEPSNRQRSYGSQYSAKGPQLQGAAQNDQQKKLSDTFQRGRSFTTTTFDKKQAPQQQPSYQQQQQHDTGDNPFTLASDSSNPPKTSQASTNSSAMSKAQQFTQILKQESSIGQKKRVFSQEKKESSIVGGTQNRFGFKVSQIQQKQQEQISKVEVIEECHNDLYESPNQLQRFSNTFAHPSSTFNKRGDSSSLNRSQALHLENSKLEEKIKELQLNLASLPTQFQRPKSKSNYSNVQGSAPFYKSNIPATKDESLKDEIALMREEEERIKMQQYNKHQDKLQNDLNEVLKDDQYVIQVESTMSTSPDKKSFSSPHTQQKQQIRPRIEEAFEEERKNESPSHSTPIQSNQFNLSPSLRKKISTNQGFHSKLVQVQENNENSDIEEEKEDHVFEEIKKEEEKQTSVTKPSQKPRQSLTALYKKQNKLQSKSEVQQITRHSEMMPQKHEIKKDKLANTSIEHSINNVSKSAGMKELKPIMTAPSSTIKIAAKKPLVAKKKIVRDHIEEGDDRAECEMCGRRFAPEAFEKHTKICEKVFMKKRKEFNVQKQRTIGEEHQKILEQVQQKHAYYENQKLNQKWKMHSAQFRAAINSSSKHNGVAEAEVMDDRVECEFCGRKFASETASRHIPLCQKKAIDKEHKIKSAKVNAVKEKQSKFKGVKYQ